MKTTTWLAALAAVLLFAWYLFADRFTPYTSYARTQAIVLDVVPEVSGYVSAVAVRDMQVVEAGDLLVRIDQRPFVLAVQQAEAQLQLATQNVGAGSSGIEVARANLTTAEVNLANVQVQSKRIFELEPSGNVSKAKADDMRAQLAAAKSQAAGAQADLEKAQRQLGAEGADNAQIQQAVAALGKAQLDLEWTELRAPYRGVVVDPTIGEGTFARAGESLMNLVSFEEIWLDVWLTENNLARVNVADPAEITLDLYPGRIFQGKVSSITLGVSAGPDSSGKLPSAPSQQDWLRDAQRFPVRVTIEGYEIGSENRDIRRTLNGQSNVIVYTGDNWLLNTLGAAWIRLISWLSYAY